MKSLISLTLLCFLVSGCALFPTYPDYKITQSGDLIGSNSPMIFSPESPKQKDGTLEFKYRTLIKNTSSSRSYELHIHQAIFMTNQVSNSTNCQTWKGDSSKINLKPGASTSIECEISVTANAKNQLLQKDTLAYLMVPAKSGDVLRFDYALTIEQFE